MEFHEILNRLMKDKGINQAELCRRTGIASSAMSHYVRGESEPSFTKVISIARALGVPVDLLAGRKKYSYADVSASDALTADERELLSLYRSLDKTGRQMALRAVRGMASVTAQGKNQENVGMM